MKQLVRGFVLAWFLASGLVFLGAKETQDQPPLPREVPVSSKQPKISSALAELMTASRGDTDRVSRLAVEHNLSVANGRVMVIVSAGSVGEVSNFIAQMGGEVDGSADDLLRAAVPIERLSELANLKTVRWISQPASPADFTTTSEGVAVIGANPWLNAGLQGQSVRVGILDVGFRGYTGLLGNELPSQVTVRSFRTDGDLYASDHGTAVSEIVYDVAPGANLYLTNFNDEVGYGQAVNWLIQNNVRVINSSAGYYCRGAQDGQGQINSFARQATDRGIVWVNSAGNAAKQHWVGNFTDPDGNGWLNFDGTIEVNELELQAGNVILACLSWDDWPLSGLDYDFYLLDSQGRIIKSSDGAQSPSSPTRPLEEFTYSVATSGKYYFAVKRYSASRVPRMHIFVHFLQGGVGCAIETALDNQPRREGTLNSLRRFRDDVLTTSGFGRGFTDIYYRHSLEMAGIVLFDSSLRGEALSLIGDVEPLVASLSEPGSNRPEGQIISANLVGRMQAFISRLSVASSSDLRSDIERLESLLQPALAVSLTPAQYWDRIKTLEPPSHLDSPTPSLRYRNANWSLANPADSSDVVAVGAVYYGDDSLEDYSSQGPTLDGRIKPDVSGPTRVCTVTRGNCTLSGGGFAGTSGAAPHIAGAAALLRQLKPNAVRSDIDTQLRSRTVDLFQLGPDNQSGWGRVDLGSAYVLTNPIASIDSPQPGANVSNQLVVSGWAVHPEVLSGTGVDAVHVYLDGPAGQGRIIGAATYGLDRPDVANAFSGRRMRLSGYSLTADASSLAPGAHTLYMYVHSTATDWSVFSRQFNKTAVGPVLLAIDSPANNAVVSGFVRISGWAIHPDVAIGTGVDAVHIYLDGLAGGGGTPIAAANYGLDRPDVANAFGNSRFRYSGYNFDWNTASLAAGGHTLYVYVHSAISGWSYFTWPIRK